MILLFTPSFSFPLENPVMRFLVILIIILFAPIIFNKIKIPHILGLIIAGALIGPYGFNVLERDSSIILSGTAGLLYIMFLAGIEIDLSEFKRNSFKSFVFGMYTFLIPMGLGILAGFYLLEYSIYTTVLLASMFASHTLIVYPILSKFGITKNRAVSIGVGGTMITDTLALLVLAAIVGLTSGNAGNHFWLKLGVSFVIFSLVVSILFPILGRWFFKKYDDSVSQYIFVLTMVFLGAVFAEIAGIEAIIGAFLAGLSLNRLIPSSSPLMNRVVFVGNAIFIPFFLIGVGMLMDYRVFFADFETIKVAIVMTVVATVSKFLAAWLAQKSFKLSVDERRLIFGLSNAQAAATLAAVTVGYNIIMGYTEAGVPIRLFNESILNGTIVMILVTCTIATFVAQKGARNVSLSEHADVDTDKNDVGERFLLPAQDYDESLDEIINLCVLLKNNKNSNNLFGLNVVYNTSPEYNNETKARKILDKAAHAAASADLHMNKLLRYDISLFNGITSVIREHHISDLLLGVQKSQPITDLYLQELSTGVLNKNSVTTFIYKSVQPISTIKRHLIIIPENAHLEIGFLLWIVRIWNMAKNSGAKFLFYAYGDCLKIIQDIHAKHHINAEFFTLDDWEDFLIISRDVKSDDNMVIILSRENKQSYHKNMNKIPFYLSKYFSENSFILIYPIQFGVLDTDVFDLRNASMLEPINKLDEIGKNISKLFKRK